MVKTDKTMSEPIYALCSFNRVKKWGRKTKKKQERHENMRPVSWKCGGGGRGICIMYKSGEAAIIDNYWGGQCSGGQANPDIRPV